MKFELVFKIIFLIIFSYRFSAISQEYNGITLAGDTIALPDKFILVVVNEYNCKGCLSTLNEIREGMRMKKNWYVFIDLRAGDMQSATSRAMRLFDVVSIPKDRFVYKIWTIDPSTLKFCGNDYSPFLIVKGRDGLNGICYNELFNEGLSVPELRRKVKVLLN